MKNDHPLGFPRPLLLFGSVWAISSDVLPILLGLNYFWLLILPAFFIANLIRAKSSSIPARPGKPALHSFLASFLISGIDLAVISPGPPPTVGMWYWTKTTIPAITASLNELSGDVIAMPPALFITAHRTQFKAGAWGVVNRTIALLPLMAIS
jgi:hypothetical protein